MLTRFIGDVHGKMGHYLFITDECQSSIQVGDFGAGFVDLPNLSSGHRFIRGNHDDPAICSAHPNWIKDVTVEGDMFLLGGAWSIDRALRTQGFDWWSDEECSWQVLDEAIGVYEQTKPRIVVTHDGPDDIMKAMFPFKNGSSRTSNSLQAMFDIHQPEIWIAGHWHIAKDEVHNGTRFIILPELGYMDLDIA